MDKIIDDKKLFEIENDIKKKLLSSLESYNKTILYLSCDAPIGVLCLPKAIETILLNNGILRVYDIFNVDLAEIKGLGDSRLRDLTTSLDKFLAMSL